MGLLELLFGTPESEPPVPERVPALEVRARANEICAPCTGELVPVEAVPDPVFACGAMGPGVGIKPSEGVLYAPVSGEISVTTHTLHAIGLHAESGADILIHVGVDTVNLKGAGFVGYVNQGQHVRAGEPLMTVDLARIAEAGYSDVVIMVVTNTETFAQVTCAEPGKVSAGDVIMRTEAR